MEELNMIYAMQERIGKPQYFYGREKELNFFMKWIDNVPNEVSKSTAILSRRKKGKTALVERLFNIIYTQNRNIIPFYYEVKESPFYISDFVEGFYFNFVQQYISFKTRDVNIMKRAYSLEMLRKVALENGLKVIAEDIGVMIGILSEKENYAKIIDLGMSAPHRIASMTGEYVVQIIDEFQYMNKFVFSDRELKKQYDLAGIYMSLAESKVAPVLATGSLVNWLKHILRSLLPARFKEYELGGFTEEEAKGSAINYSKVGNVEITEDVTNMMGMLLENDPYYISSVVLSDFEGKDLTTEEGLVNTIEFEVTKGSIFNTWREYIETTFETVNNVKAKRMALFLAGKGAVDVGIKEIIEACDLEPNENECYKKLRQLEMGDLINRGSSAYFYSGIGDSILLRVLRKEYSYVIEHFDTTLVLKEDRDKDYAKIKEIKKLKGKLSYNEGHYLEYDLKIWLQKLNKKTAKGLKDKLYNCGENVEFKAFKEIKDKYIIKLGTGKNAEIDIYAENVDGEILVIECKNIKSQVGKKDVEKFLEKVNYLKNQNEKVEAIFYSVNGFRKNAVELMEHEGIMWSDRNKWIIYK